MSSITDNILTYIQQRGNGAVFTPRDFIHLGSRSAIDTALCRLSQLGKVRRLSRGLYDLPRQHPLLGTLSPSLDDVATAIARDTGNHIQITGARALHLLGLTTQVPAKLVYLTSGPSRRIQIGQSTLQLKHATTKNLVGAGTVAGTVLQALRYLGKNQLNDALITQLQKQLTAQDKDSLQTLIRFAPHWARNTIHAITMR
ncbi:MAG: hypothetical protein DHS20C10_06800 [marine bacterium B5-7]|nr:MAG: hypothetical protein DHS20C10_06800 [marine bacterium B5-7]